MHTNPVRSWGLRDSPASQAEGPRGTSERMRPSAARTSAGLPMIRVIEGELLDKNTGADAYHVARRWRPTCTAVQREPHDTGLYIRRAHAAIGSYLDTAVISAPRGVAHVGLDLYA